MTLKPSNVVRRSFHAIVGLSLFFLVIVPAFDTAQANPNEYILKCAFMERFTRFVKWPEPFESMPDDAPFVLGVFGPNPFGDTLETVFSKQPIKRRPVEIRFLDHIDDIPECHLVFIGDIDDTTLLTVIDVIRNHPVLAVSDTKGFAEKGVHINMFVQHGQIRFEINHDAATASGLQISYHLLKVAIIVNLD